MPSSALRNTWIICKHECLKRIRTRSFLMTTFLMPGFLAIVIGLPTFLGARAQSDTQRIVVACPRADLAQDIREGLVSDTRGTYRITIDSDVSDQEHRRLMEDLSANRIDGFVWIDAQSVKTGTATYERRSAG